MESVLRELLRERAAWVARKKFPSPIFLKVSKLLVYFVMGYVVWNHHEALIKLIGL
jgi:hypothetical protein